MSTGFLVGVFALREFFFRNGKHSTERSFESFSGYWPFRVNRDAFAGLHMSGLIVIILMGPASRPVWRIECPQEPPFYYRT
jgi:hypothetical protein